MAGPLLGLAFLALSPLVAAEGSSATRHLALGVLAHDRGPLSDENESGVDLNLELQWRPAGSHSFGIGSPHLRLGVTPNFEGDTSLLYASLAYEVPVRGYWLVTGFLGLAVHDGPLHKEEERCREKSDCGFGSRVVPIFGVELGFPLAAGSAVSLYFDHVSHQGLLDEENEGIDHLGLRYRFDF
jgi:hypothetical protein